MSEDSSRPHKKLDAVFAGGLAWSAGGKWLTQVFSWASVLIAARLLSPADFGMIEMASFFTNMTNLVAEFGIGTAVLQMHELDRRHVAQLNTVSILACAIAYGLSAAAAPLIASFFRVERIELLIVINSLGLLITGFQAIPMGLLQRDLDYKRLSIAEAVQAILTAVITVVCAASGAGYWSLVAGAIGGKAVVAALTFYWKPVPLGRPRWNDILAPIRLAWHVTVSRVAWGLCSQSDGIVIGRTMGDSVLGMYRLSINLASAPAEKISMLLMRVTGPLFAKVQADQALVRRYFLIVSESLALSVFPLTFGLAAVAPDAVSVILGPKWAGAVSSLRWLALFSGIRVMSTLMGQVLISLRFTAFSMWMAILSLIVMPVSFYVASHWGAGAVAAAWIVLSPVTIGPVAVKLLRVVRLRYRDYLQGLIPALIGSVAMVAVVLSLKIWLLPKSWGAMPSLAVQVAAGGAVYAAVMMGAFRERVLRYVRFLQQLRKDRAS